MSEMDRLTDGNLLIWSNHRDDLVGDLARELLVHRRASQTAPAPTRAEVEALAAQLDAERTHWVRCIETDAATMLRCLASENAALRERAEAAEAENQRTNQLWEHTSFMLGATLADLSAARRAEAAAWNDAIEAAALEAEWRIMPAFAASIRALRRANPLSALTTQKEEK